MNKIELLYYIVGAFQGIGALHISHNQWKWGLLNMLAGIIVAVIIKGVKS